MEIDEKRKLWDKPESDWTDEELIAMLTYNYGPTAIPPCSVCGEPLTMADSMGPIYACAPGFADRNDANHYNKSRCQVRLGDSNVMMLVDRFRKLAK